MRPRRNVPRLFYLQAQRSRYKSTTETFAGLEVVLQHARFSSLGCSSIPLWQLRHSLCFRTISCRSCSACTTYTMSLLGVSLLCLCQHSLYTTLKDTTYTRCRLHNQLIPQNTTPEDLQRETDHWPPALAQQPTAPSVRDNVQHGLPLPRCPAHSPS